jgi:hypothetical protein
MQQVEMAPVIHLHLRLRPEHIGSTRRARGAVTARVHTACMRVCKLAAPKALVVGACSPTCTGGVLSPCQNLSCRCIHVMHARILRHAPHPEWMALLSST